MATFGTTVLGVDTFGARVVDSYATPSLTALGTRYGEVALSWSTPPGSWSAMRLVRNASGSPIDIDDGVTLFTDPPNTARTSFTDTGLTTGRVYYYKQFVQPITTTPVLSGPSGYWIATGNAEILIAAFQGGIETLYNRIPEFYKSADNTALSEQGIDYHSTFLYRFLAPFGFHADQLRTDTDHLLKAYDATAISERLLPSLAAQFGVNYEPALGSRGMRRLTDNAVRIWQLKGTFPGVRELANAVTGYGAHVRINRNLALDNADAGPCKGIGHWTGRLNSRVTYRANPLTTVTPAGDGVHVITSVNPATPVAVDLNASDQTTFFNTYADAYGINDPQKRLQYAVPVVSSLPYVVSSSFFCSDYTNVTPQMQWLDVYGQPAGPPTQGARVGVTGSTWTPVVVSDRAYPSVYVDGYVNDYGSVARYLEVSYLFYPISSGVQVLQSGFQVEETVAAGTLVPARETLVYLDSEAVNYVTNTNGAIGTARDWSTNVSSYLDATYGQYLTPQDPLAVSTTTVTLADAELLDIASGGVDPFLPNFTPGYSSNTLLPPAEPTKVLALQAMEYVGLTPLVSPGQTWTAMCQALDPDVSVGVRTAQIGMHFYDGPDLQFTNFSPLVDIPAGQWFPLSYEITVPVNPTYDRVKLVIMAAGGTTLSTAIRNVALEQRPAMSAFSFDGATPSVTGDFLWEGTPFASRSHYYHRRAPRVIRLQKMLDDYVPYTSTYKLVYAYSAIPDSPRAASGSDLDPALSPPQTVGVQARCRWRVNQLAGTSLTTRWQVFGIPVGKSFAVRWYTKINYPVVVGQAGVQRALVWSDNVRVPVGLQLSLVWNDIESFEMDDAELVDDLNTSSDDDLTGTVYNDMYVNQYSESDPDAMNIYLGTYGSAY